MSAQYAYATAKNNALTRSGFEHYYELQYPESIRDFQQVWSERPDDPFAANHLAAALFFDQLYRAGALESTAFANNSFLNNHSQLHMDPAVDSRLKALLQRALELENNLIHADSRDANAYYARGVTRGLQATYIALVQKSWLSALGNAKSARQDHEKVLELDPAYSDARLVVGMHSFIVGSLPWAVRVLAHVVGEGGSRSGGIRDLYVAANGDGEASVDAKVVLALFLRREQRFNDALALEQSLTRTYPHNFLFALERANILKDEGKAAESIAAYRDLLAESKRFENPQLEFAAYGLGEALKGQRDFAGAAAAYQMTENFPHPVPAMKLRCELLAGEMYDLLRNRAAALKKYQTVIAQDSSSGQAEIARENLKHPYHL